jgi:hypothetical protein
MIKLSYWTLPDPVTAAAIERNFADIVRSQGNITNKDIAYLDPIAITKFRATRDEVVHTLTYAGGAGIPVAGTAMAFSPIPFDTNNWQPQEVSWLCTDTGNGSGQVKIAYGYYTAAGAWTAAGTLVAALDLPNGSGADGGNQGSEDVALANVVPSVGGNAVTFRLESVTAGANYLSAATDFLTINVRMTRVLQQ